MSNWLVSSSKQEESMRANSVIRSLGNPTIHCSCTYQAMRAYGQITFTLNYYVNQHFCAIKKLAEARAGSEKLRKVESQIQDWAYTTVLTVHLQMPLCESAHKLHRWKCFQTVRTEKKHKSDVPQDLFCWMLSSKDSRHNYQCYLNLGIAAISRYQTNQATKLFLHMHF